MFYRHNKTIWYQFCNFKHFLKAENSKDSLASSCAVLLVCHVIQYETGLLLELGFRVTQNETGLLLELSHSLNENQPMHPEKRTFLKIFCNQI